MNSPEPHRIDRRVAIKWMLTASAGAMLTRLPSLGATPVSAPPSGGLGYGTDPNLMKEYKPGDYWPLTFTGAQRRGAALLCDIILPGDAQSPSASSVGVTDFVDEWVSAPYPDNVRDGKVIMAGLSWLDAESTKRFGTAFADASDAQRLALCEDMSMKAPEGSEMADARKFFALFRNLVASGYFTTPEGMKAIGYVGNVPLARFEGPPADLVAKFGLTDEVKW